MSLSKEWFWNHKVPDGHVRIGSRVVIDFGEVTPQRIIDAVTDTLANVQRKFPGGYINYFGAGRNEETDEMEVWVSKLATRVEYDAHKRSNNESENIPVS